MHYYYSSPLSLLRCLPHFVFSPAVFFFFFDLRSIFHPSSRASLRFALRRLSDCSEQRPIHTSPKKGAKAEKKRQRKEGKKRGETTAFHLAVSREAAAGRQAGKAGRQAGRGQAVGRRADDRSGCSGNSTLLGELQCSAHQDKKINKKNIFSK